MQSPRTFSRVGVARVEIYAERRTPYTVCLQCHPLYSPNFYSSLCSSIQLLPIQELTRFKIFTNGESKERDYTARIIRILGVIILPGYDGQREESNGT